MSVATTTGTTRSASKGPWVRAWRRFLGNSGAIAGLCILVPILLAVITYPLWWPYAPNDIDLRALNQGPGPVHWFGTDGVGRDILARLLQGGRISLTVAVISVAISIVIGFLVGAIASFGGRFVDNGVMRLVDLAMTLPPVIFLLVLASIAGTGIAPTIVVISLLSWPVLSRMVRARLMELRERDFVVACCSATDCPTASISWWSTRRCRSLTPSCSKQACHSSVSALRRPRRAGATCSTLPARPSFLSNTSGSGCSPVGRWC